MIEEIACQLDTVRQEMAWLLNAYTEADERDRDQIYERCETLGGEIQELVALLKLTVQTARRAAEAEAGSDPAYCQEITELTQDSLAAIHAAGTEAATAISVLRESRHREIDPFTDLNRS